MVRNKEKKKNTVLIFYSVPLGETSKFRELHMALYAGKKSLNILFHHFFEGLKQSHAPAVARKVLLSITSWHPHNNLDNVLHPSQIQEQRLKCVGL